MKKKYLTTLMIVVVMLTGCSMVSDQEREAHKVNGDRYIPMLREYIKADETLDDRLKDTYYMGLNTWQGLIDQKAGD